MTIICLDWEKAHLHGEAWISHHQLRYRIFVKHRAWQLPTYAGIEYDAFDTPAAKYVLWLDERGKARGAVRLVPTTMPYMVETLWPEMLDGNPPKTPDIWEASRFCCDRDCPPTMRRRIVAELICACQEFGLANGVRQYLGVMRVGDFRAVLQAAGCSVKLITPNDEAGRHDITAAYIDVSWQVLAAVRRQAGITGEVLIGSQPGARRMIVGTVRRNPARQGSSVLLASPIDDCDDRITASQ